MPLGSELRYICSGLVIYDTKRALNVITDLNTIDFEYTAFTTVINRMIICGDLSLPTNLRNIHSVLCWNFTSDTWPACANFKIEFFRNMTPCFFGSYFLVLFTTGRAKFLESQKLFAVPQNLAKRRRKMIGLCVRERVPQGRPLDLNFVCF
jgi:hypothetical protein